MTDISDREDEITKERRRLDIERLTLHAFRTSGKFILALPGYYRMEWQPKTESEAVRDAAHAASIAVNTPPQPLQFRKGEK